MSPPCLFKSVCPHDTISMISAAYKYMIVQLCKCTSKAMYHKTGTKGLGWRRSGPECNLLKCKAWHTHQQLDLQGWEVPAVNLESLVVCYCKLQTTQNKNSENSSVHPCMKPFLSSLHLMIDHGISWCTAISHASRHNTLAYSEKWHSFTESDQYKSTTTTTDVSSVMSLAKE